MPAPFSNLLTFATALGVGLVLVPVLRLAVIPWTGRGELRLPPCTASRLGSASVLLAVVALVPMGGDGIAMRWADPRMALGLLLAGGLAALSMTSDYRGLETRQRLILQAVFAFTATLLGLKPAGVTPDLVACCAGTLVLVGCCNILRFLDGLDGLAAGSAAVAGAFLALLATFLGVPEWCDLNLGLCGALLALAAFDLSRGRFKVCLGESGCLCVGFLIGLSLLRLSAAAAPGTRPALALVIAVALFEALYAAARTLHLHPGLFRHASLHHLLARRGLAAGEILVLYWTATAVSGLAAARFLHLLD